MVLLNARQLPREEHQSALSVHELSCPVSVHMPHHHDMPFVPQMPRHRFILIFFALYILEVCVLAGWEIEGCQQHAASWARP
jgi:hypothetical protein